MTSAEARKVGGIACMADGECHVCSGHLIVALIRSFPQHADTFRAAFKTSFDMELEEADV